MGDRIGEVIEATTTSYIAQSYELHQAPDFGSFVRVSDGTPENNLSIIGVVCFAETCGVDPGRRPVARGRDELYEEDVYRNNPELPELLRTQFTVAIIGFRELGLREIGFREDGEAFHFLPPRPPRIHGFVYTCDDDDVRDFTQRLDFLHTLISANVRVSVDELIAATLRQASATQNAPRPFLVRAGKELATLLINDVNRLNSILRRMRA
jgi:hypothetical protein